MPFASAAAHAVLHDYEVRHDAERQHATTLGAAFSAQRDAFLLPVGPEVGRFLHSLVLARRPARILELGTSYGYSTLFLAEAAARVGGRVISMDLAAYKQDEARRQLARAGLDGVVDFRCGDAVALIGADGGPFDLVLLDVWKELYLPCLAAFHPLLAEEAIVIADNMIEPAQVRTEARAYRSAVAALPDLKSTLLPLGNGIEVSVKWSAGNPKL